MRELRVEDALMYLDQVKVEFGDRPQIYNEFLHIMKTFKSQEIDTPGVILRVTQLFQGNKSLVLGFNTFLPDGFKIVIPDQSSGTVYYRTPGQPLLTPILNMAGGPQQPRIPDHGMAHQNMKPGQNSQGGGPNFGNINMQQQHQGQSRGQMGGMPNGGGGVKPPSQGQVQQMQSGNQQQLQQKQQQQQSPLTSGQQMNMPMMQGHPPKPPMHMQHQEQQKPQHPIQQQQSQHPMHIGGPRGQGEMHQMHQQQSQQQPQQQPSQQMMQQQPPSQQMQVQQPERPQPQQQQQQQQAPSQQQAEDEGGVPVEFDHAINYVTTIKRTFANDPDTYKKFLEILHTYQKEQRGIKEVLDEVSVLFADHPVLLKDFTYFLPDAVQQQAKMQLAHAVRQAESRRAALNSRAAIENQARQQREVHPPAPEPEKVHQIDAWRTGGQQRKPFGVKEGRSEEREREICRSAVYGVVSFDPVRPPRKHELTPGQAAAKYGRPRTIPEVIVQPTTKEAAFFERAKEHLNRRELLSDKSVTKRHTPHSEFLKCLHLYGCGILDKDELMLLLGTLFMQGHAPKTGANAGGGSNNPHIASAATKLLKEFEKLLVGRGPYARQQSALKDKSKYGCITTKEWDPTLSDDITTSYKTYPSDYPYEDFYTHSGQSKEDASVLNTEVVCVRNEKNVSGSKIRLLDSLEEYDGVRARRNIYEEALAKAEDERFEVDYALETNASAMRHVQPFAEEVTMLKTNEEKEDQPIGRMHYQLRPDSLLSTHLGAIARLYGEQGDEVLHHLMRNPISVLPIVFKRLQEKDNEWRAARVELTKHWRKVCEINHEASLDATSYFNRREIERSVTHDVLVEECKRAFHNAKTAKDNPKALESIAPTSTISHEDSSMLLFHSHISVKANKNMPHKELYDCLSLQVLNGAAKTSADRERVSRIWTEFVLPWFDLPTHWFLNELKDKARSDKSSCIVKYAIGQQVKTPFGNGKILSYEEGSSMSGSHYVVELAFGKAYVRPSSIVHHNIADVQYSRYNGCMELVQDPDYEMDEKKELPSTCQLLYGTEKIYMFMRLYCALLSLFNNAKKNMTPDANAMETEEVGESKENKFKAFLSIIKDYVNEDIEFKTYELRCRDLTDKDLFELSAIPRLLEKCGDCLVKVAKEDNLLSLYDFYRLKTMDPVLQRKQSFTVTEHASFRIQFNPVEGKIHFCYLPFEKDMLTSPRVSSTTSAQVVEKQSMETEEVVEAEVQPSKTETKVEAEEGEIGEVSEEPQSKRVKLE